jgi:hypothetical protein
MRRPLPALAILLGLLAGPGMMPAAEISVGPGRGLTRIEDAIPLAEAGDTVVVHPRGDGRPYPRAALRLALGIALRGVRDDAGRRPVLDGADVAFGVGDLPRAIVEIGPEAEGASVTGFRLTGARGRNGPAAGVRVDRADRVVIEDCEIDGCDVGVLSEGSANEGRDLLLSASAIHHQAGDNVVVGGGGARLLGCEIHHAEAGRNLVSRAHRTLVEACWLHDAGGLEVALLDAPGITDRTGGLMLVLGSVLSKRPDCRGDRAVLRCGQDQGGDRVGTLHLVHCTVVSPYDAAVVEIRAPGAKAAFANCIIADPSGGGPGRALVRGADGSPIEPAWAGGLWLAHGYPAPRGAGIAVAALGERPPFRDAAAGDVRLVDGAGAPFTDSALPLAQLPIPVGALDPAHPLRQRPPTLLAFAPGGAVPRTATEGMFALGAYERGAGLVPPAP